MRRPIVIGNWQMNGQYRNIRSFLERFSELWSGVHNSEVAICPPFPYLPLTSEVLEQTNIAWGAQDISRKTSGAYTGEVSAEMLWDWGCRYVIVGHSERRFHQRETFALVAEKFKAALSKGITPVFCIGEQLADWEAGKTFDVVGRQLLKVIDQCGLDLLSRGVIVYEPLWSADFASGDANNVVTPYIAQDVFSYIRDILGPEGDLIRILYGGNVRPDNAELFFSQKDIDGALINISSRSAEEFVAICVASE